jgi:hypothetical protein
MIQILALPVEKRSSSSVEAGPAPVPLQRAAAEPVRLDLECGQSPRERFQGVDQFAQAEHRVNLLRFPWPWETGSVDEIHCSHFVEQIPTTYFGPVGKYSDVPRSAKDKDIFFAFFDECWRILRPGGLMSVILPTFSSNRVFQDPAHRRCVPVETLLFLGREWRELDRFGHYRVACDIIGPDEKGKPLAEGGLVEEGLPAPELQAVRDGTLRNVVGDCWVQAIPAILAWGHLPSEVRPQFLNGSSRPPGHLASAFHSALIRLEGQAVHG